MPVRVERGIGGVVEVTRAEGVSERVMACTPWKVPARTR